MTRRRKLLALVLTAVALTVGAVGAWRLSGPDSLPDSERVVLVHGLGLSEHWLWVFERRLLEAGYDVHLVGYPSLTSEPDELVAFLGEEVAACCTDGRTVNFVAHSLGGLLVRAYLDRERLPTLGRVVLIGTPNGGSELAQELGDQWWFRLLGPTARELGPDGFPASIGPPDYPLGVIAGNQGLNPIGAQMLEGENDGTVSVESTRIDGMADFRVLPVNHTWMMFDDDVARETLHFLSTGRFSPESDVLPD